SSVRSRRSCTCTRASVASRSFPRRRAAFRATRARRRAIKASTSCGSRTVAYPWWIRSASAAPRAARCARPDPCGSARCAGAARLPGFDRASVGFPGVLIDGVVRTAANLHPSWIGRRPVTMFRRILRAPVRVINDADMQGLGIVEGRGSELVVTLGTGIGSALFLDGRLVPKLELGHHPFRHGQTYEQQL